MPLTNNRAGLDSRAEALRRRRRRASRGSSRVRTTTCLRDCDRVVAIVRSHDGRRRSEDLLVEHAHAGNDVGDDGRLVEDSPVPSTRLPPSASRAPRSTVARTCSCTVSRRSRARARARSATRSSIGLPTTCAAPLDEARRRTRRKPGASTMKRLAAMQLSPLFWKRALTAVVAAASRSASAKTTNGSEPPSSSTHFFKRLAGRARDRDARALAAGQRNRRDARIGDELVDLFAAREQRAEHALGRAGRRERCARSRARSASCSRRA